MNIMKMRLTACVLVGTIGKAGEKAGRKINRREGRGLYSLTLSMRKKKFLLAGKQSEKRLPPHIGGKDAGGIWAV